VSYIQPVPTVEYRVVARNPATASENRIHADDVARRYGYRGGLVPGVTVYGYACHAIVDAIGPAWVESGAAGIRFVSPCYDGDEVTITAVPGDAGAVELTVGSGQSTGATGWAALSGAGPVGWAVPDIPAASPPAPDQRPPAGEEQLAVGRVLGTVPLATDAETAGAYLDRLAETSPLYRERGWIHPALLLEAANRVLTASLVMPAWLHVETEVRHLRAVVVGEAVEARARVADAFARKGHRFVRLDVVWLAGEEAVAAARHTAIWRIAGAGS
jgi:acyl dehydratase